MKIFGGGGGSAFDKAICGGLGASPVGRGSGGGGDSGGEGGGEGGSEGGGIGGKMDCPLTAKVSGGRPRSAVRAEVACQAIGYHQRDTIGEGDHWRG